MIVFCNSLLRWMHKNLQSFKKEIKYFKNVNSDSMLEVSGILINSKLGLKSQYSNSSTVIEIRLNRKIVLRRFIRSDKNLVN